jgi:6-phosphogluconolactonase/glucosamine-6-phosphate isomerase/deaminase
MDQKVLPKAEKVVLWTSGGGKKIKVIKKITHGKIYNLKITHTILKLKKKLIFLIFYLLPVTILSFIM